MVKIRWEITDNIEMVDLNEFDTEWNGIYGYFEIHINNQILGFCPDRELFPDEEGNENILYWLYKLCNIVVELNYKQECELQLLSMNMAKIHFKKNDKLEISLVYSHNEEMMWSEKVTVQEFCREVICATEKFISDIQRYNSDLLNSGLIKRVIKTKEHVKL